MSDSSLIEENGRAHFLTKRFDRRNGEKIHMQTLCGIAHYDYRNPRSYSYEQAFNVMRALRLPYSQAQEMYRRMVFNEYLHRIQHLALAFSKEKPDHPATVKEADVTCIRLY